MKFYITTPLYYANAEPHVGSAYTTIAGDVLARYHRMKGDDVFFLTGTDEHGQKIARSAKEKGLSPKQFVDSLAPKFQETWKLLGITNDYFIRTTDPKHESAVQSLFKKILESGDIYSGKYKGWYCTPCERYLLKDEVTASVTPTCPVCHRPAEFIEETNYFFRLSKYQNKLLEHLKANPNFIRPQSRYNETRNRLEMGIEDISISRSAFDWGVPMPNDASSINNRDGVYPVGAATPQVIWVWFDALINYISAVGYPQDTKQFNNFWPADVHLMAKEILWFHSVIWPAMLLSAGIEPPKQVFAHGWWTMNAEKISKSKGNVVYPKDVIEKVGVNGLRYFMLREVPFGLDGDFNDSALINRYNNDLGNDLGNLILRVLTMIEKYFQGKIPMPSSTVITAHPLREPAEKLGRMLEAELDNLQFSIALERIWELIRQANKYIDETKPWSVVKQDIEKLKSILYALAETMRITAVCLAPFMPWASQSILKQLGAWDGSEDTKVIPPCWKIPKAFEWGQLKETQIAKAQPLFPRIL